MKNSTIQGAVVAQRATLVPASIQVQTTNIVGDSAQVCDQFSVDATHWSVYLRGTDGLVEHVKDFALNPDTRSPGNRGMARTSALICAAELSMKHNCPIEDIK